MTEVSRHVVDIIDRVHGLSRRRPESSWARRNLYAPCTQLEGHRGIERDLKGIYRARNVWSYWGM